MTWTKEPPKEPGLFWFVGANKKAILGEVYWYSALGGWLEFNEVLEWEKQFVHKMIGLWHPATPPALPEVSDA